MSKTGNDKSDVGGFAIVPHWLVDAIESHTTLTVWCILARHANSLGEAFPSLERLSSMAGISASTLRRALNELQVLGALEIQNRWDPETGRQQSNSFFLRMAHPSSREDFLMARDVGEEGGRVSPVTGGEGVTHGGGEGTTHEHHNKNQIEQETTTQEGELVFDEDAALAGLLSTASLGYQAEGGGSDALLIEVPPAEWWADSEDRLARAFAEAWLQVPKFQHLTPEEPDIARMLESVRRIAPDDDAVLYEIGTWMVYNRAQPKKGGTKDPVLAFRNWCAKRAGTWAVEKDRRRTRQNFSGKVPRLDPAEAHNRLMLQGIEEPY